MCQRWIAVEQHFGTKVELADEPDAAIARGAAIVAAERWQMYNVRSIGVKLATTATLRFYRKAPH